MGPPVQIVPAPGVERRYIDRLTGDAAKFLARMQKPAPGYIVEESFRHFRCRLAVARPGIIVTLPRFHASTLPRFHASTLPRFPAHLAKLAGPVGPLHLPRLAGRQAGWIDLRIGVDNMVFGRLPEL
jgi:hypothetical protein